MKFILGSLLLLRVYIHLTVIYTYILTFLGCDQCLEICWANHSFISIVIGVICKSIVRMLSPVVIWLTGDQEVLLSSTRSAVGFFLYSGELFHGFYGRVFLLSASFLYVVFCLRKMPLHYFDHRSGEALKLCTSFYMRPIVA